MVTRAGGDLTGRPIEVARELDRLGDGQDDLAHLAALATRRFLDPPPATQLGAGDFSRIVYFNSEQDARRFEQEPPTSADEPVLERLRSLMANARCFDLRDPQMLSPSDVPTY